MKSWSCLGLISICILSSLILSLSQLLQSWLQHYGLISAETPDAKTVGGLCIKAPFQINLLDGGCHLTAARYPIRCPREIIWALKKTHMPNLSHRQDWLPSPTLRTPLVRLETCAGPARTAHFQGQRTVYSQIRFSERFPLWLGASWPGRGEGALHKADVFRGFAWEKSGSFWRFTWKKKACTRTWRRSRSSQIIYWLKMFYMYLFLSYWVTWMTRCLQRGAHHFVCCTGVSYDKWKAFDPVTFKTRGISSPPSRLSHFPFLHHMAAQLLLFY